MTASTPPESLLTIRRELSSIPPPESLLTVHRELSSIPPPKSLLTVHRELSSIPPPESLLTVRRELSFILCEPFIESWTPNSINGSQRLRRGDLCEKVTKMFENALNNDRLKYQGVIMLEKYCAYLFGHVLAVIILL